MDPEHPHPSADDNSDDREISSQLDTLDLSETSQEIVRWMARHKTVTLTEVAAHLNQDQRTVQLIMNALVNQGLIQQLPNDRISSSETSEESLSNTSIRYQLHLGTKRKRQASSDIWKDLGA